MAYDTLQTIEVVQEGGVLHARLNRPDVRNAFNGQLIDDIHALFDGVNHDSSVRVVVLSGNGKSFSAGADLGC